MSDKFWYLTSESFKKKVKSKWFVVANIFLALVLVLVINIDKVITYFGGDFDNTKEIIVLDKTDYSYDTFKNNIDNVNNILNMDYEVEVTKSDSDVDTIKNEIKDTDKILVILESDLNDYLTASIISDTYIETAYYQYLYQVLSNVKTTISLSKSNIDIEEFNKVTSSIEINRIILSDDKTSEEEMMNTIMGTVFPTLILPFFILVAFLVQMIGTEINEEKSSRSMEIIISNVSPRTHFFSKILASNAFIISQTLLLIAYGVVGLIVRNLTGEIGVVGEVGVYISQIVNVLTSTGIYDKLLIIIPLTLILMILSFLTYSLVAGILASMTVNMEDFQQIQTPIMFISLIGYYLAIMAGMFNGSIFIKILSYVPLISALLSPALLITGQIGIIDVLISITILIIFNCLLVKFGLKIYKIGILNYSTDKMWKKIFKAARE